jgi:hypothetical protein
MVQYADKDELGLVPADITSDYEVKIFGAASLMDLIRSRRHNLYQLRMAFIQVGEILF